MLEKIRLSKSSNRLSMIQRNKTLILISSLLLLFLIFVSVPKYVSHSGGACIMLPIPYKKVLGLPWKPSAICGYNGIIWGYSVLDEIGYWSCVINEQGFCFLFGSCNNTSCRTKETPNYINKTDTVLIQKFISEGCTSYYDGCNTCTKNKDGFSCTIMWCSLMNEPKCLNYEEKIVITPKGDENNSIYHKLTP